MAKIRIELNEQHIKLIKNFKPLIIDDYHVGYDSINPYGGDHLVEDIAMILGHWGKAIPGTERDYDGRKFGIELEQEMLELNEHLMRNFRFILSMMGQFIEEGIKEGEYTAIDTILDWTFKSKKSE